jgi:hypothetical protein
MIIPGPIAPGMNINVYLQPLISELQELWNVGVHTYDISMKKSFVMRTTLMWTINDFPTYADLSGWSTRGSLACPCCMHSTGSTWLTYGRKYCYMGHRRWLPTDHKWRQMARTFDNKQELGAAPVVPDGGEILRQLQGFDVVHEDTGRGKRQKTVQQGHGANDDVVWKKKSIVFTLPYWKDNLLRHNLDVMHIEKNVMDNIIGTLLDMKEKTKDNHATRLDLHKMDLRKTLHPFTNERGKTYLPAACHTMSNEDKINFLKVIKDVRVPDGYASNVFCCVNLKARIIVGMKSHDNHILMQQLLPIALRGSLEKKVVKPMMELSAFFRGICSKTLTEEDLARHEAEIPIILCKLEQIFPPDFFTIMVHVVIHLVRECRLGGPVHYRWMYPVERSSFNYARELYF